MRLGLRPAAGLLCLIGLILLGLGAAPARASISSQDQQEIASLRRIFGIDPADASDAQIAQLLDAPEVGASLRGDVACAYLGEHALDGTAAEKVELQVLLSEYSSLLAADQLLDPIAIAVLGDGFAVQFLLGLHGALSELHSAISTFVDAEASLESDRDYRSWLAQYYGAESDGKSAEEAREELESTAGSALDAVTQPRHLSRDQLFAGYEYASGCMRLDADPVYRQGYANLIVGIVEQIDDYENGDGLTLVPIAPDAVEAINTGRAEVSEIALLDSAGTFTATAGEQTVKRTAQLEIPPPWDVHWSTSTGEDAVAPEVPIEFEADPSIPEEFRITWSFDDGHSGEGREVTHSFESAGARNVTMYVEQPGCSSLSETRPFRVGRSTDWLSLSGSTGTQTLSSSVAGYVVYGPTYIHKGQTLTVEPGANVKFVSAGLTEPGQLIVEGTLKVQGAAGAPAVFTSKYDDTAGGHCTCAPSGHTPAQGDWYGITLLGGGVAAIDHADVRYAGPALDLPRSPPPSAAPRARSQASTSTSPAATPGSPSARSPTTATGPTRRR